LHVGSYTSGKGHKEAIEIFLRSNVKDSTLLMIGNNHEAYKYRWWRHPLLALKYYLGKLSGRKRIIFNYFPRAFTVAAYRQSDLFLFPSNIECSPIVLFESAAAHLPFLASDVGNSIEISKWTGGGEIMPTKKDSDGYSHVEIKGSVEKLERIYRDEVGRRQMADRAFAEWKKRYSWEVITLEYERLYQKLLARS
jgi:glycosyltransferase involved in cell wall biosynthesis